MRIVILLMALTLSGCRLDLDAAKELGELRQVVQEQRKAIEALQAANTKLTTDLDSVKLSSQFNAGMIRVLFNEDTADLDLTDKNFSTVRTSLGTFLISVQDVSPFANGLKVKMHIGNPQAMTYPGIKIKASWTNASSKSGAPIEKEIDWSQSLLPGAWNRVEMVLSPADPKDIENVKISIVPSRVQLHTATR